MKQGKMYIYFVGAENKAYYNSPMFGRLLAYLSANPRRCQIRQKADGRNSFSIARVPTVEEAVAILTEVLSLRSV